MPYPIEVYSIKANNDEKIIISTSNKKYYKKLEVLELARLGLPIEQTNIDASHKYNTLIVTVSMISIKSFITYTMTYRMTSDI